MAREVFNPQGLPPPMGPYAHGAVGRGARMVFISGQVPQDAGGRLVGRNDILAQTRQVLANIRTAVEAAGGTVADICKITVFLVELDEKVYGAVARARREFFGEVFPASTLVQVKALASADWLVEIEAYAVI
jgi:enamine deaminase RidA (YjgF/YER057c/UK114 family)